MITPDLDLIKDATNYSERDKENISACVRLKRVVGWQKLRQKMCGFRGHRSGIRKACMSKGGTEMTHIRLICKDCGFKTKWFDV